MLDSQPATSLRAKRILKVILCSALILHLLSAAFIYAFKVQSISTTPDPLDYRLAALNMIQYHIFSLAPAGFQAPQLLRTPMYPAILAATYYFDGQTGYVMIILQSILLIIMGWLLFKLLRAFKISENISLMLTALYLLEPLQWLYTLQTMTETIASFLCILLLAGALVGKGISTIPRAILFGIGLGLLDFQKPSASMWIPFLLLLILCTDGTWRARFARVIIAGVFAILVLTPWMIRNYDLTGHIVVSSSEEFNFILYEGATSTQTAVTVPALFYEPVTRVEYNFGHQNGTAYAYTTQAYPMLLATQHALLQHANYFSIISQQIACAPSVWFGNIVLQDQESYGHEYSLIADFIVHPNPKRDAIINVADTIIWTLVLLLSILGSVSILWKSKMRFQFLLMLGTIFVTVFINFCASWFRVLLPMYPIIFIATGAGISFIVTHKKYLHDTPSLLRRAEHDALSTISLSDKVADLGGDVHSEYHSYFKGNFEITSLNMDEKTAPDVFHDLEKPLPFPNASFDHALLINVMEHIFEHRQLLTEAVRIVKPGGSVIIAVPFLFPIHPSPRDFWRFSKQTLEAECANAGLTIEKLVPLGTGVFSVRYVLLDRLMPSPIRFLSYYTLRYITLALDSLFTKTAHLLRKRYDPAEYALGYVVQARKP
jgi:SAM-dependent methyltransferase